MLDWGLELVLFPQGESPLFFFLDFISFNMFLSSCNEAGLPWLSRTVCGDVNGEEENVGDTFPFFPSLLTCVGMIRLEGVTFLLADPMGGKSSGSSIFNSGCVTCGACLSLSFP